ncbi:RidA family protein [Albibacterium indicum]|uniref:RidA family protein n=1 Tax=Albibacterium indicum TaxID=2292082 RepID=UPI000E530CEB|nr:RidA family protein [Pedobacter indicus]
MKTVVNTSKAPAPIGPYNQAIKAGNTLYISGQIPMSTPSGELVSGDISKETKQVMENIGFILEEAGYNFRDIVKTTIFLADMNDFSEVNGVYGEYFDDQAPARETVAVKTLPKNVRVEISAIAFK